jgi:hypothetical protein
MNKSANEGNVCLNKAKSYQSSNKIDPNTTSLDQRGVPIIPPQNLDHVRKLSTPSGPQSHKKGLPDGFVAQIIERYQQGHDLGIKTEREAQKLLEELLRGEKYDLYRNISSRLVQTGILQSDFRISSYPFRTLQPSMNFLSVKSILERPDYRYHSGIRADSLELRIAVSDHEITLIAPRTLDFDLFIHNVGVGITPYLSSSLLEEINEVVIDPGQYFFKWSAGNGRLVNNYAAAYASVKSGRITFLSYGRHFTPQIFHHEVGHLIADRLAKNELPRSDSPPTATDNEGPETSYPGDRFAKIQQEQGSSSEYGSSDPDEGFAVAWSDYMTNEGKGLSKELFALLRTLGIPSGKNSEGMLKMIPFGRP